MTYVMPAAVAILEAAIIIRLLVLLRAPDQHARRTNLANGESVQPVMTERSFSGATQISNLRSPASLRGLKGQRTALKMFANVWRRGGGGKTPDTSHVSSPATHLTGRAPHTTLQAGRHRRSGSRPGYEAGEPVEPASLRAAFEILPFAILIVDGCGTMMLVNREAEKLFDYGRDELIGAHAGMLVPALHDNVHCAAHAESSAGPHWNTSAPMRDGFARRRDGSEFPVEVVSHRFRFENQSVLITVVVDKTERYELYRNRDELAHLTRVSTLGELAGSLAHELNQPLTGILSNVQAAQRFMEADPIDLGEMREILKDIVQDGFRASEVIRSIRALVKKGAVEFVPLDLARVLRDAVMLVHSDSIVRGIRMEYEIDDDLPVVRGDKVQLQQVMLNLLLNAFDAMGDCKGDDRLVEIVAKQDRGGSVRISVRDRGHGLTVDKLEKIFKPFFTSKPKGLGLGLSICRSIVDMHGGRLWAENNAEYGATFHVSLPSAAAAAVAAALPDLDASP